MKLNILYGYGRFSTDEQVKGTSYQRQLECYKHYCISNGYEFNKSNFFFDEGISGWKGLNRKHELGRLLAIIKPNEGIFFENIDRLSREKPLDCINFMADLTDRGIILIDGGEVITKDNLNDKLLPIHIRSYRSNDESKRKSDHSIKTWKIRVDRINNGEILPVKCGFWLDYDSRNKIYKLNDKAKVVKEIFNRVEKGDGIPRITNFLNQNDEYRNLSKNGKWSSQSIHLILHSESVTGKLVMFNPPLKRDNYFPSIISDEQFNRVQYIRASRYHKSGNRSKHVKQENILQGILKCKHCGSNITTIYCNQNNKKHYNYICGNISNGNCPIGYASMSCNILKQLILSTLTPSFLAKSLPNSDECFKNIERMKARINAIEIQKDNLIAASHIKKVSDMLSTLEKEKETLEKNIQLERGKSSELTPDELSDLSEKINDNLRLDKLDADTIIEAKRLIKLVYKSITIDLKKKQFQPTFQKEIKFKSPIYHLNAYKKAYAISNSWDSHPDELEWMKM